MSFSFIERENMAQDVRKQMGAKTTSDSVDPLKIQIEGVQVITISDLKNVSQKISKHLLDEATSEWSAMSVPLDAKYEKWVIVRNHKHDIERQRVSLLEEFWHIMLGHSLVRIINIGNHHGRTYHPEEEEEAYYLASATLLPKDAVEKFVDNSKRNLDDFAKKYGVSTDLIEYRIKRLGLWYRYKPKKIQPL